MIQNKRPVFAFLRLLHALPDPQSFDFYLDDVCIQKDVLYEDFTQYTLFNYGKHIASLHPHKSDECFCKRELWLSAGKIYTLVLAFYKEQPTFFLMTDTLRPLTDACFLRLGHFSPIYPILQLPLNEETPLFKHINALEMTGYISLVPETYHFCLIEPDSQKCLFAYPHFLFKRQRFYSFYIVGGISKKYPLKMLLSIDGNSFLTFPEV